MSGFVGALNFGLNYLFSKNTTMLIQYNQIFYKGNPQQLIGTIYKSSSIELGMRYNLNY